MTVTQWARQLDLDPASFHYRIKKWGLAAALTTTRRAYVRKPQLAVGGR